MYFISIYDRSFAAYRCCLLYQMRKCPCRVPLTPCWIPLSASPSPIVSPLDPSICSTLDFPVSLHLGQHSHAIDHKGNVHNIALSTGSFTLQFQNSTLPYFTNNPCNPAFGCCVLTCSPCSK